MFNLLEEYTKKYDCQQKSIYLCSFYRIYIDYLIENKEDILLKASEMPVMVYEAFDELKNYSKTKKSNDEKIKNLELQLSKQKNLIRLTGIGIIVTVVI